MQLPELQVQHLSHPESEGQHNIPLFLNFFLIELDFNITFSLHVKKSISL